MDNLLRNLYLWEEWDQISGFRDFPQKSSLIALFSNSLVFVSAAKHHYRNCCSQSWDCHPGRHHLRGNSRLGINLCK